MTVAQPFDFEPAKDENGPLAPSPPRLNLRPRVTNRHQFSPSPKSPSESPISEAETVSTPRFSTLRSRLLLTLLPVTLLPLAIISVVDYGVSQKKILQNQETLLQEQTLIASDLSADFIDEMLINAEVVGANPGLKQALQSADQEVATKRLTQVPTGSLEQYYAGRRLLQPDDKLNIYLQTVAKKVGLNEVFVTNRDGFNVAYSQITSDFVQNDEAWWQQAKANGLHIESPEFDESAGAYVLAIATALRNETTNDVVGVIKSGASLESLNNKLTGFLQNTLRGSKQVQIIDPSTSRVIASLGANAEGEVVATTGKDLVELATTGGEPLTQVAAALQTASTDTAQSLEDLAASVKQTYGLNDLQVEQFQTENGTVMVGLLSLEDRFYAVSTIPNVPWVVVSSVDRAELNAEGRELLQKFLIIGGLLGVASLAVIIYLSRLIANPINRLSATAAQMADGDLNITAEATGALETRQLASTFNHLVRQVNALLKRQQEETERVELLAAIAQAKSDEEMQMPLNGYLQGILTKLKADRAMVYRVKPDLSTYITGEAVLPGWPSALGDTMQNSCISQDLLTTYTEGQVVPTDDVISAGFHPEYQQLMERLQIRANLVVPIVITGKLFGLLEVHHCGGGHAWQDNEIQYLKTEVEALGLAMGSLASIEAQMAAVAEQERRRQALEQQILDMMERIEGAADGDLTARAQLMEGEIGIVADLFNAVIENLQDIAVQVRSSSGQVNQSLTENETAIRDLAATAIAEAKEIQTALRSVQSMSQAIKTVAQNAEEASAIANAAYATVQSGNQAMDQTVNSILGLRTTIGDTTKKMKRLGESAQKISQVVSLIDELALKTNLLSINASVEAARAGELGQGFTAVAEQVGTLAEQSAAATRDIAKIVSAIQAETKELVEAMETGTSQVVASTQQVEQTKHQLTEVLQRSQEIDQLMRAISDSALTQARSAQNVTTVMQQVTESSKQRSDSSRQVAQAMQATAQVSQKLQASVEQFKVD